MFRILRAVAVVGALVLLSPAREPSTAALENAVTFRDATGLPALPQGPALGPRGLNALGTALAEEGRQRVGAWLQDAADRPARVGRMTMAGPPSEDTLSPADRRPAWRGRIEPVR